MSDKKEDKTKTILCGCDGMPVRGAVCGYVTVGGEYCRAPADYECEYKRKQE